MTIKSDRELLEKSQNRVSQADSTEASSQGSDVRKSSSWIWIFLGAISPLLLGLVGFGIYTAVTPKPVPVNIIIEAKPPSPKSNSPTSNTPLPTTPQNSPSSTSPLTTSNPTVPTPSPLSANTTSPEDLVRKYYDNIKSGRLQDSWNMLPSSLQQDRSVHPNGYGSFSEWWNKAYPEIEATQLVSQSDREAVVNVDTRFTVNRGSKLHRSHVSYFFTKDPASNNWTISKIRLR